MFDRYTEGARRVLFFARYEASRFGSAAIQPEHLLLGIVRENNARPGTFLSQPHLESIRKEMEDQMEIGTYVSTSVDMPLDESSMRALAHAAEEAALPEQWIDLGHLLLALGREENSKAAAVLKDRGFDFAALRAKLEDS
jgi:ATP-dependent Clp protease ATP-binding subunit ClpC